jgi:predicted phage terminase large subunit-like protein
MTIHQQDFRLTDRAVVDALVRQELHFLVQKVFETIYPMEEFQPSAYLEAMCKAVQDAAESDGGRLLVNIPPRHMKSTVISVALPSFCLGRNPGLQVMVATYATEFAILHHNQFRTVVESDWYRRTFPLFRIDPRNNRAEEIRTTLGGGRKAVAVGGSVTGRGADLLIIDDIIKASDARSETVRRQAERFYEETLLSRLNRKAEASVIAVQQRLHEDDHSAYLIAKGNYRHLNMPAIAIKEREELPLYRGRIFLRSKGEALFPEREDVATLEGLRVQMTPPVFEAQYQQEPVPEGGNEFNFDLIASVAEAPERERCAPVVQSWDPAYTTGPDSALSACTTWGFCKGKWYLLDVWVGKLQFPDLYRKVVAHKTRWQADHVIIEGAGSGTQLVHQLKRDGFHRNVMACRLGVGNKEARLIEQSARLTSGNFVIPTTAPWFRDLRQEFRAFPNGKYADRVDSVSQFVAWASSGRGSVMTGTAREVHRRMEHEIRRR